MLLICSLRETNRRTYDKTRFGNSILLFIAAINLFSFFSRFRIKGSFVTSLIGRDKVRAQHNGFLCEFCVFETKDG